MADRRSAREYLGSIKAQIDEESALADVLRSGDQERVPEAALKLGNLKFHRRSYKAARALFEQAISSGHPDYAPAAMNSLGNLLPAQGRGRRRSAGRAPVRGRVRSARPVRVHVALPGPGVPSAGGP